MNAGQNTVEGWIQIVRGEYSEVPGLHLTKRQFQRLWGLDPSTCDALLEALVEGGFLRQCWNGTYARVDAGR